MSGTFFSRRWLWGGLKCDTVVKLTFSKTFFTFFASFLILVFWAPFGEKWGSSSILLFFEKAGANFAPSRGGVSGKRFYEQNLCFTKGIWCFFLKTSILLNVFHLFRPWLAFGAPDFCCCSPLGTILPPVAQNAPLGTSSVSLLVCFYYFSTSHGIIFSKFQA